MSPLRVGQMINVWGGAAGGRVTRRPLSDV